MEMWECGLVEVQNRAKYNDSYTYMLTEMDVFSKFLQVVMFRAKTDTAYPRHFFPFSRTRNIQNLHDNVRSGFEQRGAKSSWTEHSRKKEGIQFQVCRDPNM
jgi:hypothetical protein